MSLRVEKISYIDLYKQKKTHSHQKHLENLISLFLSEQENTFLFDMIRRELKKHKSADLAFLGDWVFRRFGVGNNLKNTKKKVAFVDHSFHCKTASSMFFVCELEKYYDVDILWSSKWKGIPDSYLQDLYLLYKNAVYWQVLPDLHFAHPNNTLVIPMWDAISDKDDAFYEAFRDFQFLSFSKKLHEMCLKNEVFSRYIKVFPKIYKENVDELERYHEKKIKPSIYFWQRTNDFTWHDLRKVISGNPIAEVVLCNAVDPGFTFNAPSVSDILEFNIKVVPWDNNQDILVRRLKNIDIYVAPRLVEGIGFSFIEAIKCGCTIICNNESTMNEYINDFTGYVIDYRKPERIDLCGWKKKKENIRLHYFLETAKGTSFSVNIASIMEEVFG